VSQDVLISGRQKEKMIKGEIIIRNGDGKYDMKYLLTAVGLSLGGSTHLHTNNT
jgi:hypothetical protein